MQAESTRYEAAKIWYDVANFEHERLRVRRERNERALLAISALSALLSISAINLDNVSLTGFEAKIDKADFSLFLVVLIVYFAIRTEISRRMQYVSGLELKICKDALAEIRIEFTKRARRKIDARLQSVYRMLHYYFCYAIATGALILSFLMNLERWNPL